MQKLGIATPPVHDPPIYALVYCPGKAVRLKVVEVKNT